MAGKPGQKWSKSMTQQQRDSIALTKIELYLDKQIDGKLDDWTATRLKALEIRYNKLRPALSSADITAHSSPQTKSEAELIEALRAVIASNPQIISKLGLLPAPYAVQDTPSGCHTQSDTNDLQDVVVEPDVRTQQG